MMTFKPMVGSSEANIAGGLNGVPTPDRPRDLRPVDVQFEAIAATAAAYVSSRGVKPAEVLSMKPLLPSSSGEAA